jgi:hypothetical protein
MRRDALDEASVHHWVGGGWGVVALAGRQTRPQDVHGLAQLEAINPNWDRRRWGPGVQLSSPSFR